MTGGPSGNPTVRPEAQRGSSSGAAAAPRPFRAAPTGVTPGRMTLARTRKAVAILALVAGGAASASEPFGPFASPGHPVTVDARPSKPPPAKQGWGALPSTFFYVSYEFYRNVLSPIDGPMCIHRPTCSLYALQAIRRHPVFGVMLTVDRLWRNINSSAIRLLPIWHEGDRFAVIDPLEESDFWLRRSP